MSSYQRVLQSIATALLAWSLLGCLNAQTIANGDFSRGNASWRGDRAVQADPDKPDNKVCVVNLSKSGSKTFSQQIDTGGAKSVTISFDFKVSADYKSEGFEIKATRLDGTFYYYRYPEAPSTWQRGEFQYPQVNGSRKLDLAIEVKEGSGKIFFDNFAVAK